MPRVLLHYRLTEHSLSSRIDLKEASFSYACTKIFAAAPPEHARLESRCRPAFYLYLAMRGPDRPAPRALATAGVTTSEPREGTVKGLVDSLDGTDRSPVARGRSCRPRGELQDGPCRTRPSGYFRL